MIVGHLAHLLPVDRAVVLRCHPRELDRRLRARGDVPEARRANVIAEAIDLVASEARAELGSVEELDTTDRAPELVARAFLRRLAARRPRRARPVDWLSDRWVTEHLLAPDP